MNSVLVLKTEITSTTVEFISDYLKNEKSKTVAICNANTLVRSYRNSAIQEKINSFDIKSYIFLIDQTFCSIFLQLTHAQPVKSNKIGLFSSSEIFLPSSNSL